jgi:V/A-type H+-transporting ATPase subunit E
MAVDDILKRIRGDAEEAARQIVSEREKEAEEILGEARGRVESQRERMRARARQRADEERNRIVTLARLSARRALLSEKQALIGRVFEETRKRILGMGRDEYRRFLRARLEEAIEPGETEVIVGEGDDRIDQQFLDKVAAGIEGVDKLKLSHERRRMEGGFILRRGRMETNCSLDTFIRDAREKLETEVAAILFGAEDKA